MILDRLQSSSQYRCIGSRFSQAFDYLESFAEDTPDGRYDLDGDNLYALVQSYTPDPAEHRTFESHRVYADIQYILSGREIIYYQDPSSLTPKAEYDPKKDATFYHCKDDRPLHLDSGTFVVLWPQDAHKPGCIWDQSAPVRKVVMKVRLS